MISSAYILGRQRVPLKPPYDYDDKVFSAERLDEQTIEGGVFRHCSFANISFLKVQLRHVTFTDCVFIGCYFRRADFTETKFPSCRFIYCDFTKTSMHLCDFRYCGFMECFIPYSVINASSSLPQEHNLREELCRALAVTSSQLGFPSESRLFTLRQIRSHEENLKSAILGETKWYIDHYNVPRRILAALQLLYSLIQGCLWGYGEKSGKLLFNFFLTSFIVFPLLFYWLKDGLKDKISGNIGTADLINFSLRNMIPANGIESNISAISTGTRLLAGLESVVGLIIAGLFVSYLFRWILRR